MTVSYTHLDVYKRQVTNEVMIKTRQDDIQLIEGTKNWIDQPQRKASEQEKNYAKNRLDGVIKKIMKAMTAVKTVKDSLLQPKTKVKVVNEIKEKARPSSMNRLSAVSYTHLDGYKRQRKDRLHQNYLKRKANGKQQEYYERTKAKKKAEMDAKKEEGFKVSPLNCESSICSFWRK